MIVGIRSDFKSTRLGLLANKYGLEPVHFAMEVRCCWASSSAPNEPPPALTTLPPLARSADPASAWRLAVKCD
jgi:hypothetical protein